MTLEKHKLDNELSQLKFQRTILTITAAFLGVVAFVIAVRLRRPAPKNQILPPPPPP